MWQMSTIAYNGWFVTTDSFLVRVAECWDQLISMAKNIISRYAKQKSYAMEVEAREQERIKYKIEQRKADEEITHATGRVLFWLHHAIVKGEHNGELEEAFENLQRAEEHKKEMDREVLAKYSID